MPAEAYELTTPHKLVIISCKLLCVYSMVALFGYLVWLWVVFRNNGALALET